MQLLVFGSVIKKHQRYILPFPHGFKITVTAPFFFGCTTWLVGF